MGEYHQYHGFDSEFDNIWEQRMKETKMQNDFNFEEAINGEVEEISVSKLDDALLATRAAEEEYQKIHKESSNAYSVLENAKGILIDLMTRANKDRWACSGAKGFSLKDERYAPMPKDPTEKEAFFNFLGSEKCSQLLQQDSRDITLAYLTVHSGSLKTLVTKLTELAAEQGESLQIPGIGALKSRKKLISLRK